jgi:hypothetical protein
MTDTTPATEVLAGLLERVTFHNPENGFCVLRVKARGHRDLVTTVGHAAMISAGEWITASGVWLNDRSHGLQFKAHFLKTSAPSTIDGIEKYLGSGMIRGIGPVYAKRMVRQFGKDVFLVRLDAVNIKLAARASALLFLRDELADKQRYSYSTAAEQGQAHIGWASQTRSHNPDLLSVRHDLGAKTPRSNFS